MSGEDPKREEKIQALLGPRPDNIDDFSEVIFGADMSLDEGEEKRGSSARERAMDMIENYIPQEWQGRTVLEDDQEAKNLALLRTFGSVFHEVDDTIVEAMIETIEHEEMYRTSKEGMAREEYMRILEAAAGGSAGGDLERGSAIGAVASKAFERIDKEDDE